jgi:hypothetical protein
VLTVLLRSGELRSFEIHVSNQLCKNNNMYISYI